MKLSRQRALEKIQAKQIAFALFVLGLPVEDISNRVKFTKITVKNWIFNDKWGEKRDAVRAEQGLSIGKNITEEQKFIRQQECAYGRKLMGMAEVMLRSYNCDPYVDKSMIQHPTAAEISTVLKLATELSRNGLGMPLGAVEVNTKHELSESWQLAMNKIYADQPKKVEDAKPIEVLAVETPKA